MNKYEKATFMAAKELAKAYGECPNAHYDFDCDCEYCCCDDEVRCWLEWLLEGAENE